MKTLDELKRTWDNSHNIHSAPESYDDAALRKIFKSRVNHQTRASFQYFWSSFVLQILVYALLGHVTIRYWSDLQMSLLAAGGILLFIPFTTVLMKKFKAMALEPVQENDPGSSLHSYVIKYHTLLSSFYTFKKRYELLLIPLSAGVGVFITFGLYVPGGVYAYPQAAWITFCVTLISCMVAIWRENKKSFERPLQQLQVIIDEFSESK